MKKIDPCYEKKNELISAKAAKQIILDSSKLPIKTESINLKESEGRIIAIDIKSKINLPLNNNAAVDGYAFNYDDFKKNNYRPLKVVGISQPGNPFKKKIRSGEAIRIYTGSLIINNSNNLKIDTVVMEEVCQNVNGKLSIKRNVEKNSNIRMLGEDIKENEVIYTKGRKIRSVDLGFLASIGLKRLKVYQKIKVGVFSSGNEITENKTRDKIFDSNKITILTFLKRLNCEVKDLGIIKDEFQETKKKLMKATKSCDVIISSGGISSSDIDQIQKIMNSYGNLKFWKLAIKPGRPLAFGKLNKKYFIGLPGNPVAVIVTFLMFVCPFIRKITGRSEKIINYNLISSGFNLKKKKNRREWVRGFIYKKKGELFLEKYSKQGSGVLSSISNSEGIIEIDEKIETVRKGDLLKFYKYEELLN